MHLHFRISENDLMTTALAKRPTRTRTSTPAGKRSTPRPKLKVHDGAEARSRTWRRNAVVGLFLTLLAGLFLVAFVHAQLVESQQDFDNIRSRITELEAERDRVERAIDEASSPARISNRARNELGMVPAERPVFLVEVSESGGG